MRLISSNFRGKKILEPRDKSTRPLKDLTKEALFNIILHSNKFDVKIKNSNILDLFAGVGSFGLECLSRDASTVTFIENYKEVLPILKKNIMRVDGSTKSMIIEKDIFNELNFDTFKNKFDLIFLDPPYKEKFLYELLKKIYKAKILDKDAITIIHRYKKENDDFRGLFNVIEEKSYGISKIIFGKFF